MRKRIPFIIGAITAVGIGAAIVLNSGDSVGHWRNAQAQATYLEHYETALADGPAPDAKLDLRTDAGVVRVLRYDGPADTQPIVLLPGTQSGAPMWAGNVPSLRAQRTVYVVDLLGQPGLSVASREIVSAEDDARWLAQAIGQLPRRPAVLGHSLGGWLAMNLAVNEPDVASKIIVLDPVLTFGDLSLDAIVRSVPASLPWLPRGWRDDFASWTANDAPVDDDPVARMIEAGMQGYALGAPAPVRFTDEQLEGIDARVLVIMAGASRMHDPAAAADVAGQHLPQATVLTYPDASHAITGEESGRIAHDIADFLDD